jgi:hypothetical protein
MLQESGFGPTERVACRLELRELGMAAAMGEGKRRLQASAARPGKVLTDRHGNPIVIRAIAE